MDSTYDIIVIGAGPAGLTAAKRAAEAGRKVLLLERNDEAARKIYATGNGKCNFLNRNAQGAEQLLAYCNSIGIIETEEDGGRLYPRSRQAASVARALIKAAKGAGAELLTACIVKSVVRRKDAFEVTSERGERFAANRLIIASGGKAGIQYGCYGDGYAWAKSLGHSVVKPIPALTGLECAEDIEELHGVRVNAKAVFLANGKELAVDSGEVQFTRAAISGICVMNLSRYFRLGSAKEFKLALDLFPEYSKKELARLLLRQKELSGCGMEGLLPDKLRSYFHKRLSAALQGLPEAGEGALDVPVRLLAAAGLAKALTFTITGSKGWKEAQVSSGGIPLAELDEDFQSRLVPGLFFAGEIIDYDGPCGGYNLAWAFRSGIAAGSAAAK